MIPFLIGCEHEKIVSFRPGQKTASGNSVQRSGAEALEIAKDFFAQSHPTRSNVSDSDLNIYGVLSEHRSTRGATSHAVDTSAFVINRGTDEGFVYISGDLREDPILGFSETGHIAPRDLEQNPGLKLFKALSTTSNPKKPRDYTPPYSPDYEPKNPGEPVYSYKDYPGTDSTIFYTVFNRLQLLPGRLQWGQEDPYNRKAPMDGEQHSLAGCGPVACSQYMAYYQFPKSVHGHNINWKTIRTRGDKNQVDEIATLLRASADDLGVYWGSKGKGTGTPVGNQIQAFKKWGYKMDEELNDYYLGKDSVINRIYEVIKRQHKPFIACASTPSGGSHLWIIDGVAQAARVKRYKDKEGNYLPGQYWDKASMKEKYFHMNWGWGGANNGFFRAGVFKTDKYTDLDDPWAWDGNNLRDFHNKKYDLSRGLIVWRFSPNK